MAQAKKTVAKVVNVQDKEDKKKALSTMISQIEREYGAGSIMRLGENSRMEVQAVSTGSLSLDMALGIGGVPRGRIVEIFGPESSGKTTVALHIIAEVQKTGGEAAFIDAEHALDPVYAKALGVDINNLLVSQPDCGEDALSITESLVRSGAIDVVVVDSVAALVPRTEIDGDMGAPTVGVQARLMSQAMRKLAAVISKSNCADARVYPGGLRGGRPGHNHRRGHAPHPVSPRRRDKGGDIMKKIAILTCLDACQVCTGASCLNAWNRKARHFVPYAEEDASLEAFFHCNGCDKDPETDRGMAEKLDRLQGIGVETVHIGVCAVKDREAGTLCPTIVKIQGMLRHRGIRTVLGTH